MTRAVAGVQGDAVRVELVQRKRQFPQFAASTSSRVEGKCGEKAETRMVSVADRGSEPVGLTRELGRCGSLQDRAAGRGQGEDSRPDIERRHDIFAGFDGPGRQFPDRRCLDGMLRK